MDKIDKMDEMDHLKCVNNLKKRNCLQIKNMEIKNVL